MYITVSDNLAKFVIVIVVIVYLIVSFYLFFKIRELLGELKRSEIK